jgi:hypothetical protein
VGYEAFRDVYEVRDAGVYWITRFAPVMTANFVERAFQNDEITARRNANH